MYKKTTLKNGLRIITIPLKNTKAVTFLVVVGTGSKYETRNTNGISHFLEHLFFKGTKKRPNTKVLAEEVDGIGAAWNAFTSKEFTGFWIKSARQHLDIALDVLSDMFLNSKFEATEIERERGVITEEINMYQDTPMRYVGELLEQLLYGDQPAGWLTIGTKEVIRSLKRDDFLRYFAGQYVAPNIVICVAGDIGSPDVLRKIKRCFRSVKKGDFRNKRKVLERQKFPQSLIFFKKTDQSHLCLGVRAYNLFDPRRYALALLGVIIGGNMSSRLFIKIRERLGLAYYIKTSMELYTDSGYLLTSAGVDNGKAEKAIRNILAEYQKVRDKGVSEEELKKAKEYLKGGTILALEGSDEWASWAAGQEILEGKITPLEKEFEEIDKVSREKIKEISEDIFRKDGLNLALIGPFREKDKFDKILKL